MTTQTTWLLIAALAAVTIAIKAAGPLVLGGRPLPPRFNQVVALLPAAVLAALVVTSTLADGQELSVDAATVGVAVAGVLVWRRVPLPVAVVVAVVVAAGLRAVL